VFDRHNSKEDHAPQEGGLTVCMLHLCSAFLAAGFVAPVCLLHVHSHQAMAPRILRANTEQLTLVLDRHRSVRAQALF
jgi:hypothetical protein